MENRNKHTFNKHRPFNLKSGQFGGRSENVYFMGGKGVAL